MCTGTTALTSTCVDVAIYVAPVGDTGGLLLAQADDLEAFSFENDSPNSTLRFQTRKVKSYSVYSKCIQGTY